jgi:choline dehydrogenase-like flavoprotein
VSDRFLITRRQFHRALASAAIGLNALASGCASWFKPSDDSSSFPSSANSRPASNSYEYIIVGSGAGGGPLAARLAEAGHTVLILEAGGDPLTLSDARLPEDYRVPAFHAAASENPGMRWDFFVRHYADEQQQRRDRKFTSERGGVLYPRAGTLGGCTAHNAMILVYPHNEDWNDIADLTRDDSWRAENMRHYFERLENCNHRPPYRFLYDLFGLNPTRHGFDGWLSTERADPGLALADVDMMAVIASSAVNAFRDTGQPLTQFAWAGESRHDPNDWRIVQEDSFGLRYTPLTTRDHVRIGSRERVLAVAKKRPDCLSIELDALATRIILDDRNRAIGVEYLKGERLYRAHANPNPESGTLRQVFASREVILSGGAFNTPQLLMLSGIGRRDELARHGIDLKIELPGVGRNLQDRYEVSVVNRMREDWAPLVGARFDKTDRQYASWSTDKEGVYTSNGSALVIEKKSRVARSLPDLFCLGLLADFHGYFPGYSQPIATRHNYLSWVVLKAHTRNQAGTVRLRSRDPRDPPEINFHYFEEGSDPTGQDLDAVVEGIQFVRRVSADLKGQGIIAAEELPGEQVQSREDLKAFVRNNAWGHHASCSCAIGPRESGGVVTSDFRVHGTEGLRVVDASVFPQIPGFFIVSSIYMIAEKAADVILADAKRTP